MRNIIGLLIVLALGLVIVACSSEDSNTPEIPTLNPLAAATATPAETATPTLTQPPPITPTPTATRLTPPRISGLSPEEAVELRFYNLISDFDSVAVDISGLRFASRLPYGSGIPARQIAAGTYPMSVVSVVDGSSLLEQQIVLEGGTALAGLIIGTAAEPRIQFIAEDTTPLNAEETRLNVFHAIPGNDAITVRRDGQTVTAPLTFTQQSGAQIIPPGRATFSLANGEDELASIDLQPLGRTAMTIIIYSDQNNNFAPGFIVFDTAVPGRADVSVIHMAAEIGPVDLYVNQTAVAANIDYTRSTDRQTIPTGNNRVSIYPAGADRNETSPIVTTDFNVNPDEDFAVIILGTENAPRIIRYEFDTGEVPPEAARVTFIHTVPDAPGIIPAIGSSPLDDAGPINYRNVSRSVILDAISQELNFYTLDGGEILEAVPNFQLEAGRSYLYFFTGRDETQPPVLISEVVGVNEDLTTYEGGPTPTPAPLASVTFVNLLTDGTILDFSINELIAAAGVPANTPSPRTIVPGGETSVEAAANGATLSVVGVGFAAPASYTVYAYGNLSEGVSLLVAENQNLGEVENTTVIRIVNLAEEDSRVQLAYSNNTGPLFRPTPDATSIAEGTENFFPISPDMVRITPIIESPIASDTNLIPTGLFNLFVIDEESVSVIGILEGVEIQLGQQYDVIFRHPFNSPEQVQIINYPSS